MLVLVLTRPLAAPQYANIIFDITLDFGAIQAGLGSYSINTLNKETTSQEIIHWYLNYESKSGVCFSSRMTMSRYRPMQAVKYIFESRSSQPHPAVAIGNLQLMATLQNLAPLYRQR
jgi:hypothetical protein